MEVAAQHIKLPISVYPENVVEKARLAWQNICQVTIKNQGDFLEIEISVAPNHRENQSPHIVAEFLNYILDATIQDYLTKQSEEV